MNRVTPKKSIMGPIISVFVMVLVISILSGLTFLFVSQLRDEVETASSKATYTANNETLTTVTETGENLAGRSQLRFVLDTGSVVVTNASTSYIIDSGNYTLHSSGIIYSTGTDVEYNNSNWNVSYAGSYIDDATAYTAVNDTEAAGATLIGYLSLIFLAVIFGAILTLVLRIILPYINLGKQVGGF